MLGISEITPQFNAQNKMQINTFGPGQRIFLPMLSFGNHVFWRKIYFAFFLLINVVHSATCEWSAYKINNKKKVILEGKKKGPRFVLRTIWYYCVMPVERYVKAWKIINPYVHCFEPRYIYIYVCILLWSEFFFFILFFPSSSAKFAAHTTTWHDVIDSIKLLS